MQKEINILHITDLHISEPRETVEHLRDGYYEIFIDGLVTVINEHLENSPINCIVISGDFVHLGKTDKFSHASKIIQYLCNKLKLNKSNVGVCIGNHDFSRDLDKISDGRKFARQAFYGFAKKYSHSNTLYSSSRGVVASIAKGVTFLSLDATLGCDGKGEPGAFETKESDSLLSAIRDDKIVPKKNLLIIASHYPLEHFTRQSYYSAKDYDAKKHFWQNAADFREDVSKLSIPLKEKTLWLFGDTHVSAEENYDDQYFVMTGRFGTSTNSSHSQLPREARVITFKNDGKVLSHKFHYVMKGHEDNPKGGFWKLESQNEFPVVTKQKVRSIDKIVDKKERKSKQRKNVIPRINTGIANGIQIIDLEIENKIEEIVTNKHLYQFGKFVTSSDEISLGWISINQLMSDNILLPQIILKSHYWLNSLSQKNRGRIKFNDANTVIIGIDFWGSIISSQLSVETNFKNLCVSSKADGQPNSTIKGVAQKDLKNLFSIFENIILISDVVSSGKTIHSIYTFLNSIIKEKKHNWFSISIISDSKIERQVDLTFLKAIGTFCGSIRIPIMSKKQLPDNVMLPPSLDNNKNVK